MARRQPFAPFRATALENEATALRAHALAKSMGFGATAVVRLISSLQCDAPCEAPKVDIVPLFERRETNNRILLCQGIDSLSDRRTRILRARSDSRTAIYKTIVIFFALTVFRHVERPIVHVLTEAG